uniref:Transmembrane protein n=1 Tax=Streptomyces sp. NBC_01401 TaxID=2903854 RepID=A0AAU3GXV8_9ACTN
MRTRDYDTDFLDRAGKTRAWGIVLLAAASFLWLWGAALLVLPNGPCESRLFTDGATANTGDWSDQSCQRARDWPKTVALFASSIPVMAGGVTLFTLGTVTGRISAHSQAVRELDRQAAKRKE